MVYKLLCTESEKRGVPVSAVTGHKNCDWTVRVILSVRTVNLPRVRASKSPQHQVLGTVLRNRFRKFHIVYIMSDTNKHTGQQTNSC